MKCSKIFQEIDGLYKQYLDILEDVCNVESPTNCKKGIDEVGNYFIKMAKDHSWKVEIFEQEIAGNVICITLNPEAAAPPITVSGHIDTVHPLGLFGTPATRRNGRNMYGPGVMDCKGGVVAAFLAMEALDRCGFKSRPVQLLLQTDEETGSATSSKATIKYICEKAKNSIAFLNLEGHVRDTAVLIRKGILRYRFTVRGKALHSSLCYDAANAIAEAAHKILQLEKMKDPDGLTCNCGTISGGTAANTVAETCVFYADIRFSSQEDLEKAKQCVKRIADASKIKECSCVLEEVSYRPAMPPSEKNRELLRTMNTIYSETGLPVLTERRCPGGSDAAYITECGIPCVDSLGTEGGSIHSANEYIEMDSLVSSAKRIAAVVYGI